MEIERWWVRLDLETRAWLIAHNGDVVPDDVVAKIVDAGALAPADPGWLDAVVPGGILLSDATVDWIEETANA